MRGTIALVLGVLSLIGSVGYVCYTQGKIDCVLQADKINASWLEYMEHNRKQHLIREINYQASKIYYKEAKNDLMLNHFVEQMKTGDTVYVAFKDGIEIPIIMIHKGIIQGY